MMMLMFNGISDPYLLTELWKAYYSQIVLIQLSKNIKYLQRLYDLYGRINDGQVEALEYYYEEEYGVGYFMSS